MINGAYKTLDLFAGIGGIRLGFERAGFKTVFANDYDHYCRPTYNLNFGDDQLEVGKIQDIKSVQLPDFDVLLAGFPCQSFSIAGYRRGFLDTGRGDLFFEIVRILRDKRPRALFLENVKNLKTHDKGKTFRIISSALKDLGYHIKTEVLNSVEYGGVPQNRERIYIVGFLSEETKDRFSFPKPVALTKNVSDVLEKDVGDKYYYNKHKLYKKLEAEVRKKNTVYQWRRTYVRENKSGVCPTLTANMGTGGHNVPLIRNHRGVRKLTPRECARLQGFPESYKLPKELSDTKLYKQIGNSVTIGVVEKIAKNMLRAMSEDKHHVYRKTNTRQTRILRTTS